ncbi:MAG TPA: HlyD family efflux transporter periplasmic adaptor subunit [Flavobacteriia bacterium]|nr:HlyD family efflux transporter periplasmic adaptor subunit [Flavobacteriia bacterium]
MNIKITLLLIVLSLFSCKNTENKADAYGNFEATEVTVSSEANGKLMQFNITEGQQLKKEQLVAVVDTIPLHLQKEQLRASKSVVYTQSKTVSSQVKVLKANLQAALRNKKRIENLVKENAATQKQLDDINDQITIINKQISAAKLQDKPILKSVNPLNVQVQILDNKIANAMVRNPINGTVLTTYAEPFEITSFGRPLYKIADLSTMEFKGYISEKQLSEIKIGDTVTIKIDTKNGQKSYNGTVSWIASEAEFTPKIIQTKDERVNLVYAIKVKVKNDGAIKIGMPAEMWMQQ